MSGKTIRQYIFIFSLCCISIGVNANNPLATKQQIGMFKNSKTCVVLESGVSFFNAPVKEAVQKYWKATGYEFIDQKEFEIRRKDPKYSFIVLMQGEYDKDPEGVSYSYISLLLGDRSDNITKMPEFCSIPLSYSGDLDADYEYIVPAVIKFMQIHVKNLEKDRFAISINGLKFYNKSGYKDKVLLLNKDKMAPDADTPEKISAVCSYKVKLLSVSQIRSELTNNTANTLFHFHVGPPKEGGAGKCFEMLFDADGNLDYYNSRKVTNENPDGFNLSDFNNIR
jgi:hypothetical protein